MVVGSTVCEYTNLRKTVYPPMRKAARLAQPASAAHYPGVRTRFRQATEVQAKPAAALPAVTETTTPATHTRAEIMSELPSSMRAVVINGPHDVEVKEVPVPQIEEDTDVLIKVHLAGLCGSDLHAYRGHEAGANYVMGHEVVGTIVATGSAVTKFKLGDRVLAPFSISCGSCFYCDQGYTSRCVKNKCLTGGQAEYFRMPLADASLFTMPEDLPEDVALLMTDILPTGYSAAMNARRLLDDWGSEPWGLEDAARGTVPKKGVAVVVGCGPVGLCAISSALTLFETVYATDLNTTRLRRAEEHGAIALPKGQIRDAILGDTKGRGADAVIEVVGHESALVDALRLVRPYGAISSVGVHTQPVTVEGDDLYGKNVRMQFGRCSVRTFWPLALSVLRDNIELFKTFVENKVGIGAAGDYYRLFEQGKVAKTVFVMSGDSRIDTTCPWEM